MGLLFLCLLALGALTTWLVGSMLMAPCPRVIDEAPAGFPVEEVEFVSETGSKLRGWFAEGKPGRASVVLLHGLRGDRRAMVKRARILSRAGMATLMLDLQGHGESEGDQLTFGHLESQDARAAVTYLRTRRPGMPVGLIGSSLGGAAALLGGPVAADALVLEMVYPTLLEAVRNRVGMFVGDWGASLLTPLLTVQCRWRLGFDAATIRPIDALAKLRAPVLIIGGELDLRTPPAETQRMYDAAKEPKGLWMVPGARHEDICALVPDAYAEQVLAFFTEHLR